MTKSEILEAAVGGLSSLEDPHPPGTTQVLEERGPGEWVRAEQAV